MDFDAATIMQGLVLAGVLAILRWVWMINARVAGIESDVKHGFDSGRTTMKRHSEKLSVHDDEIRSLELTAAEHRGRDGSNPGMRSFRGGDDRP